MLAATFEQNLSESEKKKHLLEFIGGGITPSKFLINDAYNKINQKRKIELINLNSVLDKKINFTEGDIKTYFENNKNKYNEIYKSVKILELTPRNLIDSEKFDDLFFKKIDEIDNIIVRGENLEYIIKKFNFEEANSFTINEHGKDTNNKIVNKIPKKIIKNIFHNYDSKTAYLEEVQDKFFILEISRIESIQKNINDDDVKKNVLLNLGNQTKRELISEIISKINNNNFDKLSFDKLAKNENISVQKITLLNMNDSKKIEKELVNQIYMAPKNKVILINDINLIKNFLVYVDKIENVNLNENSEEYNKYYELTKAKIKNELFNTYDKYIRKRFEIEINHQALKTVKNYFN